jgi:hypothetical protein
MGEMRNTHKILIGKPKGKVPLSRYMHRWEDNTGLNLRKIVWESVDWIHLAQDSE